MAGIFSLFRRYLAATGTCVASPRLFNTHPNHRHRVIDIAGLASVILPALGSSRFVQPLWPTER